MLKECTCIIVSAVLKFFVSEEIYMDFRDVIGSKVRITVDRPLGSLHPRFPDMLYEVNYGFVEGVVGGDGEWQDAYILGVDEPVTEFVGVVLAVIRRRNDSEVKWVVVPKGMAVTKEEIVAKTYFCERYFDIEIII